MRMKQTLTILITIFLFVSMVGAASADTNPTPPHLVHGYIKDDGNGVNGIKVKIETDDGTKLTNDKTYVSTKTDSEGYYKLKPNGLQDGKTLSLYVDGKDIGEDITYSTGKVEQVNHEGNYLSDSSDDDGGSSGGISAPGTGKSDQETKQIKAELKNGKANTNIKQINKGDEVSIELESEDKDQKEQQSIKSISFKSNGEAQDVNIEITDHGETKPETVTDSGDSDTEKIYRYFEIKHDNLDNENIDSASITFEVDKDWVKENNAGPTDVGVKRFHGDDWDEVEVSMFDETEDKYIYKAKTPGFSHYSIYLKETGQDTDGTSETTEDTKEQPSGEPDQEDGESQGMPGFTAIGLLAAGASAAFLKRKQDK
ncbi:Gram-positive anchor (plasmid) [Methanohalobium evestigatum Z-7303]|uniref:Gram-positive anchor n=1 Tax=Methanohalobium evestigatum (strain ATCC BAA-1072 / DSM 3721 / NBRC 107634 / OCM 161 / Z-7303) TaxID=644295 RepID=D7EC52_METEZ|nr:PGF-pre-PGF domain-containing protein [Methanohalobium evestigatum]ADI75174.1 Gram-positive anchor [Methanohalobium evestigatum Z-7303]